MYAYVAPLLAECFFAASVVFHECSSLAVCAKPRSGVTNATVYTKTASVLWFLLCCN